MSESNRKPYTKGEIYSLNLDDLKPNPEQVRQHFDKDSIAALAASILEDGLLQNITFTQKENQLYVVSGGRRFEALNHLKKQGKEIPLSGKYVEGSLRKLALVENIFREDMTAIEFAESVKALQDEDETLTQGAIGSMLGLKRPTINGILSIAKMPDHIRDKVRNNPHVSRDRLEKISRLGKKQQEKAVDALIKGIEKSLAGSSAGSPLKGFTRGKMVAGTLADFTERLERFGKEKYAISISPPDRDVIREHLVEMQSKIQVTLDNMAEGKESWDKQYEENQKKKQEREDAKSYKQRQQEIREKAIAEKAEKKAQRAKAKSEKAASKKQNDKSQGKASGKAE